MRTKIWVGVLGAALAASSAGAQDGPQTSTISVTTRLVVLDLTVTDGKGRLVPGLKASQFTVTEDKVPQTIKNFEGPSAHAMPGGGVTAVVNSSADLQKIGQAPVNVLVFDEVNTPFHDLAHAREMMEAYLKAQPEVLPVPTLFVAAGFRKMAVLHDYTQSRADLLQSIRTHTSDFDFTQMVNRLNGGTSGSEDGFVKTLGALSQIAASVSGVPGRKNVIWMGQGYNQASDLTHMSEADRDKVEKVVQQVTNRMLAARVTLYTIDPAGVTAPKETTEDEIDPNQPGAAQAGVNAATNIGFDAFAPATGGRNIGGRNDMDKQVEQITKEGMEFYTLSYVPTSTDNAARPYRKIHVAVNDPSLHVLTRDGYFGGEAPVSAVALAPKAKQAADVKFDLMSAARTTIPYTGLHMRSERAKNGYTLLVNANDLRFNVQADGSRLAEVTVIAVCYNAKGKEVGQHAAELKQRIEATDVIKADSMVGMSFPMAVPAFTTRVRFVMRDAATGVLGSADAVEK